MGKERSVVELRACLIHVQRMLDRARLLEEEYEEKIRRVPIEHAPEVSTLKHTISFPELRSLDLFCLDAIKRWLPEQDFLLGQWHTFGDTGHAGPGSVITNLLYKRSLLESALALLESSTTVTKMENPLSLPSSYVKLTEAVERFFADSEHDCQDYDRNVFLMTRFVPGDETLATIDQLIRDTLASSGLVGHRADDRCYPDDRNLWDNVCTYMLGCKFGIAVLESVIVEEFNPNVALEYGFMRGLGKPTLLLKEERFRPRADLLGTLWESFDILKLETSIPQAINRWISDLRLNSPALAG